jgi:hypothetical protein
MYDMNAGAEVSAQRHGVLLNLHPIPVYSRSVPFLVLAVIFLETSPSRFAHSFLLRGCRSVADGPSYNVSVTMAVLKGIHWVQPVVMVLALLSGGLFALGNHLFYSSLDGTVVQDRNVSMVVGSISEQQFNLPVGNTFATLVKISLALAVGTGYA